MKDLLKQNSPPPHHNESNWSCVSLQRNLGSSYFKLDATQKILLVFMFLTSLESRFEIETAEIYCEKI